VVGFVVCLLKGAEMAKTNSFPRFLPPSETVVAYSKHKWKCSNPSKWISRLCLSEMERGKQVDH